MTEMEKKKLSYDPLSSTIDEIKLRNHHRQSHRVALTILLRTTTSETTNLQLLLVSISTRFTFSSTFRLYMSRWERKRER